MTTTTFRTFSASEHLRSKGIDPSTHSHGDLEAYYDRELKAYDEETEVRVRELAARRFAFAGVKHCQKCGTRIVGSLESIYPWWCSAKCRDADPEYIAKDAARAKEAPAPADPSPPVSQRDWDGEARAIDPRMVWEFDEENQSPSFYRWALRNSEGGYAVIHERQCEALACTSIGGTLALARLVEDRNASDERNGPDRYRRVEAWDARLEALRPGWKWRETCCPDECARWVAHGCAVGRFSACTVWLDGGLGDDTDPALVALVRERNADQLAEAKRGTDRCEAAEYAGEWLRSERPAFADHDGALAILAGGR